MVPGGLVSVRSTAHAAYTADRSLTGRACAIRGVSRPVLLVGLITVVIVSRVLLLGREDPGVGMAL